MCDNERTLPATAGSLVPTVTRMRSPLIKKEISMDESCQACSSGPVGFAGHADLMVQTVGDTRISLRCGRCGFFWVRTLERKGDFAWAPVTERMAHSPQVGVAVPPRSPDRASGEDFLRSLPHNAPPNVLYLSTATHKARPGGSEDQSRKALPTE
jgi:hypothetical protein